MTSRPLGQQPGIGLRKLGVTPNRKTHMKFKSGYTVACDHLANTMVSAHSSGAAPANAGARPESPSRPRWKERKSATATTTGSFILSKCAKRVHQEASRPQFMRTAEFG